MLKIRFAVLAALLARAALAQELPPPPRLDVAQTATLHEKSASVDSMSRTSVASLYNDFFVPLETIAPQWTGGNVAGCVAGTTSSTFRDAVLDRVNAYRALAGLPGNVVQLTGSQLTDAQNAAMLMSRNNALSHSPPSSWPCWSASAANGASHSNLAIGAYGVDAIDLYMDDWGSGNTMAGHRRWILYPPQTQMATGDIPSGTAANDLWVFGPFGSRPPTPNGVAWPPRGYVPYQMLPAGSHRWSFGYPGANFSAATVTMSVGATSIPVTLETIANGYGDNTLVWVPQSGVSYTKPAADTTYHVVLNGVSGSGVPTSFAYDVVVIDPAVGAPAPSVLFANEFE